MVPIPRVIVKLSTIKYFSHVESLLCTLLPRDDDSELSRKVESKKF